MPTLFLMVGLPGSGKTTRALDLEREHAAIRFSLDEWMKPLFGVSDIDGRRDVLEGRLIWTASRLLRLGENVILDFGLWGRDERAAFHWLAGSLDATAQTVFVAVDSETQLERVRQRFVDDPSTTWEMDEATLDQWRAAFQEPSPDELDGSWRPAPPDAWIPGSTGSAPAGQPRSAMAAEASGRRIRSATMTLPTEVIQRACTGEWRLPPVSDGGRCAN